MHSRAITSLQQIQNNTTRRALLGHKNVDVKSTDALSPPPFLLHPFPCFPLPQTWFHPHHFHSSLSLPFLLPALSFPSLEIQLRHLAEFGNTTVERNFDRLQRVQNIHAKDACQALQTASASDLWWLLHWLPIRQCIVYKTSLLTYKILMSGHPQLLMPINWVLWTRMEPATVIISSSVTAPVENSDLHHMSGTLWSSTVRAWIVWILSRPGWSLDCIWWHKAVLMWSMVIGTSDSSLQLMVPYKHITYSIGCKLPSDCWRLCSGWCFIQLPQSHCTWCTTNIIMPYNTSSVCTTISNSMKGYWWQQISLLIVTYTSLKYVQNARILEINRQNV